MEDEALFSKWKVSEKPTYQILTFFSLSLLCKTWYLSLNPGFAYSGPRYIGQRWSELLIDPSHHYVPIIQTLTVMWQVRWQHWVQVLPSLSLDERILCYITVSTGNTLLATIKKVSKWAGALVQWLREETHVLMVVSLNPSTIYLMDIFHVNVL